jgi:SAM-dependent methyltransferase
MTSQSTLLFEQLLREFGRPAPADPARRRLLETLTQRGLLREGSDVLVLLAPAELVSALASRGAHVTAIEPLETLLEHARQQVGTTAPPVHWVRRTPQRLPFRRAFDLVLAPSLVLGTTGQEVADDELLRALTTALRPGGALVLELPNRELLVRDFTERLWGQLDDLVLLVRQRWDLPHGTVQVQWQLVWPHGAREKHERTLRLYTASELVQRCQQAGCATVECWSDDDGAPYELWSPRLLVVARTASEPAEPLVVGNQPGE